MKHWFHRYSIYAVLRIAISLFRLFPYKAACYFGRLIGAFAYYILARERRKTLTNLDFAFSESKTSEEKKRIARAVFENLGRNLAELVFLPTLNKDNVDRFVELKGKENIDQAFARGKGVIALSAHFGNWELLAAYFALKGYPISVVARPLRFFKFDNLLNGLRRSVGIDVLERDSSLKRIISTLRKNQSVAILPDQDVDSVDGVFVEFFGKAAYTPTGPVAIAQAIGATILPIYIFKNGRRHKIVVEEPLDMINTGQKELDLLENTQRWMKVTESYIRKYPEQWVWMHRRWKTQIACLSGRQANRESQIVKSKEGVR